MGSISVKRLSRLVSFAFALGAPLLAWSAKADNYSVVPNPEARSQLVYDPGAESFYGIGYVRVPGDSSADHAIIYRRIQTGTEEWTSEEIYSFAPAVADYSKLAVGQSGELYGSRHNFQDNTIFKLKKTKSGSWIFETIYSFPDPEEIPTGPLIVDRSNTIYGQMSNGFDKGSSVYRLVKKGGAWRRSIVKFFDPAKGEGLVAYTNNAPLLYKGILYVSATGGPRDGSASANGSLYALVPGENPAKRWGSFLLHAFYPGVDGKGPRNPGGLVSDGNWLYGTTSDGGVENKGVIFRVKRTGGRFKTLWNFHGKQPSNPHQQPDGHAPNVDLLIDRNGNLFGTSQLGGAPAAPCEDFFGCGKIFGYYPNEDAGTFRTLHSFRGFQADGSKPTSGVVAGPDDNLLYGLVPRNSGAANWGFYVSDGTPE